TSSPTASGICPGNNGTIVQTSAGPFVIQCALDHYDFDMADSPVYPGSYYNCLNACASRPGCVQVTYNDGPCYLKSGVGSEISSSNNNLLIGGHLLTSTQSSSSSASASSTTSPGGPATVTITRTVTASASSTCLPVNSITCPGADQSTYQSGCNARYRVECYADRQGTKLAGVTSPTTNDLNGCIAACDSNQGCVDVSWNVASGLCTLKSTIGSIVQNSNVYGAQQSSGCTSSSGKIKFHRKRVVHHKRQAATPPAPPTAYYGPDLTFIRSTSTATSTQTSTSTVYANTITATVTTTPTTTSTVTQTIQTATVVRSTVTSCPTKNALKF
ncbi:hypothetical protein DE146DRAFT_604931, partial [Phaeosphaeria sp. MPI-PUGE-AT-0046c]